MSRAGLLAVDNAYRICSIWSNLQIWHRLTLRAGAWRTTAGSLPRNYLGVHPLFPATNPPSAVRCGIFTILLQRSIRRFFTPDRLFPYSIYMTVNRAIPSLHWSYFQFLIAHLLTYQAEWFNLVRFRNKKSIFVIEISINKYNSWCTMLESCCSLFNKS